MYASDPDDIFTEFIHEYHASADGWMLGPNSELLFWVPPCHREGLWTPKEVYVIAEMVTRLDMSRFVHGKSWQDCVLRSGVDGMIVGIT